MHITPLMALYNEMPKFAQLLATETTISSYKGVISREWYPNSVSGSYQRIRDWFGCTVTLDVPSTADDLNNANHPYGAVFREVSKRNGGVNKAMYSFPYVLCNRQ